MIFEEPHYSDKNLEKFDFLRKRIKELNSTTVSIDPVSEDHRPEHVSLLTRDCELGAQWNFRGSRDPSEIVDGFYRLIGEEGVSWTIFEDGEVAGLFSIYPTGWDGIEGLWTKTHLYSDFRGRGINEVVKMAAVATCDLHGEPLYSLVMKVNERSMKATLKTSEVVKTLDTYLLFRTIPSTDHPDLISRFDEDLSEFLSLRSHVLNR